MLIIVLILFCSYVDSAVLTHGHAGEWPGGPTNIGTPCESVCCVQHVFKCINTDFVGSTNT